MENQVVVKVNPDCHSFECIFRDGVSEKLFDNLSQFNRVPGWSVKYGVNRVEGGLDKSIVMIHYNKAKEAKNAAESLEVSLRDILFFREILWKRGIDYRTLEGNHVSDIFD